MPDKADGKKFIVVSNRLPVSVSKVDGKLTFSASTGGLATAMTSLEGDKLWVGWPGISSDELTSADKSAITRKLRAYNCVPVFLTANQVKNFYEGYANDTIWPLFHYFQSLAQFDRNYWPAYVEVNKIFSRVIARYAHPEATLWIHDYHLMLLPKMLRELFPKSTIGFFLHVPFPSFEIFRLIPERKEILEGLLGASLVGFHTYDYVRHFTSSVLHTLGYSTSGDSIELNDRKVAVDAFPIGIDYEKFTRCLTDPTTEREMRTLEEHYGDMQIILSVDRLDYSKGIPNRLRAFEDFLEQNPRFHKKVVLMIIAVPSRTEVQTYKDLRDVIEQTVSRINGKYATLDWTPISYQFRNIPFERLVALYAKAAVALITPLRDGMNLVAKEFVACKQDRPGVLILSELTGAADELQEAVRINPNDTASIVKAIKTALTMPVKEQKKRMLNMQQRISHYTVQRWVEDFMMQLQAAADTNGGLDVMSSGEKAELLNAFEHAKSRSLFLDYDGTLTNFVSSFNPKQAAPSRSLLSLLRSIAEMPHTELHIISGRTREALDSWFGSLPITLVAEHGAWVKQHGEWAQSTFSFRDYKRRLRPILNRYADRTPGAFVEEKDFSLVWHYRNTPPELAYARNASLRREINSQIAGSEVGLYNGNKIIEIKGRSAQKGAIIGEMLASSPAEFILCAGDDYTDEDMFAALGDSTYTIKIGYGDTHARYRFGSVEEFLKLLRRLAAGSRKSA